MIERFSIYIDFDQEAFILTEIKTEMSISTTMNVKNKAEVIGALKQLTDDNFSHPYSFVELLDACDCFDDTEKEYYRLKYV